MAADQHHTIATFRARYPHVTDDDAELQAVLDDAAELIDPETWGSLTQQAHGYRTAHVLALDPLGRDARLAEDDGQSTYGQLFEELRESVGAAAAPRVT